MFWLQQGFFAFFLQNYPLSCLFFIFFFFWWSVFFMVLLWFWLKAQYLWVSSLQRCLFFPLLCQASSLISSLNLFFGLSPSTYMFFFPLASSALEIQSKCHGCLTSWWRSFQLWGLLFIFPSFLLSFFLSYFLVFLSLAVAFSWIRQHNELEMGQAAIGICSCGEILMLILKCLPVWLSDIYARKFFSVSCKKHRTTQNFTSCVEKVVSKIHVFKVLWNGNKLLKYASSDDT